MCTHTIIEEQTNQQKTNKTNDKIENAQYVTEKIKSSR